MAVFWVIWMESNRRIFRGGRRQWAGVRTLWERVRFWASLLLLVASEFKNSLFETSFCDWSAAMFQIVDLCCFSKYALWYIAS